MTVERDCRHCARGSYCADEPRQNCLNGVFNDFKPRDAKKRARRTEIPNLPKQEDPTDGYRAIRDFLISEFPVEDLNSNKTTSEIVIGLLTELLEDTR